MKALMGLFWFALRRECSTTRAASYLLIFFPFLQPRPPSSSGLCVGWPGPYAPKWCTALDGHDHDSSPNWTV